MTTILRNLFEKPIDRQIDGVIKADDNQSLLNEVEEYVITNEIENNLSRFLSEYNNYSHNVGVWISGFFGSGKSHLLKILSMALENISIDEKSISETLLEKVSHDAILKGDLEKAIKIPSKSILFNIDQKANVIMDSNNDDALLRVFQSVFDQLCGYHFEGYIASFERDLDDKGFYIKFKDEFKKFSNDNISWEKGREQAVFQSGAISKAFSVVTGQNENDCIGILDTYSKNYKLSIENFANQVKKYLNKQNKEFRLNFFVDEIGQFIAGNIKLMTNLQTIAESLTTICKGQAWIIVTAQEALEQIKGNLSAKQENDFTKIMARFPIRMPLTSKNVSEVIQKRILKKTISASQELELIYNSEVNNFGTLFNFLDGSVSLKNFTDKDNFVQSYPFIPYQFDLFRESFKGLSEHNRFEGRHLSVGERSMLGVFKEVAIGIADKPIKKLVTFDLMFSGIKTALKSSVLTSIQTAERNLGNDFAVSILKVLFLVKYYRQFKPSLHNICVLMIDSFDQDINALKKNVEVALNLLEQQTYIQRNGNIYEFLTDEEKDIEQEIKNTEVDIIDIKDELKTIIFRDIISNTKIKYLSDYDYKYAQKVDDDLRGQDSELKINIITPFHEHSDNEQAFIMNSMSNDELIIILPSDNKFSSDLVLYKKTEKYIKQNRGSSSEEVKLRILSEKGTQNGERYRNLKTKLESLLSNAKLIIRGETIELRETEAKSRITKAFHLLIDKVYTKLGMLKGITYNESSIEKNYNASKELILGETPSPLTEVEQEIFNFIKSQSELSLRVSISSIKEKFEKKNYGWSPYSILANIAILCGKSKLEVIRDSNQLTGENLIKSFKSSAGHSNILVNIVSDIPESTVRFLKKFYQDFFNTSPTSNDAKSLVSEIVSGLKECLITIDQYTSQVQTFPFLHKLSDIKRIFIEVSNKEFNWFFNQFSDVAEELLSKKESLFDPITKFMNGTQAKIYQEAREFLIHNYDNFVSLKSNRYGEIKQILDDENCFEGNKIQQVKTLKTKLEQEINQIKRSVIDNSFKKAKSLLDQIQSMDDYKLSDEETKLKINSYFKDLNENLSNTQTIDSISVTLNRFEGKQFPELIQSLNRNKEIEVISLTSVNFTKQKPILETEEDVNQYIQDYKKAILKEIKNGKRITT